MTIGVRVRGLLASAPGVSALAAGRIYPLVLPRLNRTYPAISYQVISDPPAAGASDGTLEARQARVQVNCWALTYLAAVGLADAVVAALRGNGDLSASPPILTMDDVTRLDDHDPDAGDPETGLYRQIVDVMVLYIGS